MKFSVDEVEDECWSVLAVGKEFFVVREGVVGKGLMILYFLGQSEVVVGLCFLFQYGYFLIGLLSAG